MSNTYFSFKHFTIHQDRCAMKVCTDACLFGAWSAKKISELPEEPSLVLDIGTGTGLLALMLAQKTTATIHAIEVDAEAAGQAEENIRSSAWDHQISLFYSSIQEFSSAVKYDWIIANPPFFEHDLTSANSLKNAAKHDTTLTFDVLISSIGQHLDAGGSASLLIPYHRTDYLQRLAQKQGLFVNELMFVKQSPGHGFFRTMVVLSLQESAPLRSEISIHDEARNYTTEFTNLLKDYYLKL